MKTLIILILAAVPAFADYTFTPPRKLNSSQLLQELKDGGYKAKDIHCYLGKCVIQWSEPEAKNPSAIINAHVAYDSRDKLRDDTDRVRDLIAAMRASASSQFELAVVDAIEILAFWVLR